jgi:tRNA uridine 5-carboxymethylaminomethyl modification enzyme
LDELVTRGVDEPFRMFTARSEHRLKLREGNARHRLSGHGHRIGLVSDAEEAASREERAQISAELTRLDAARLLTRLKRPEVTYTGLAVDDPHRPALPIRVREEVEVEAKYAGYIAMADAAMARSDSGFDGWQIPDALRWDEVPGLSGEARERLGRARPASVGQARALPGVGPATIGLVLIHLKRLQQAATPRST